jgi:hypothetical protein
MFPFPHPLPLPHVRGRGKEEGDAENCPPLNLHAGGGKAGGPTLPAPKREGVRGVGLLIRQEQARGAGVGLGARRPVSQAHGSTEVAVGVGPQAARPDRQPGGRANRPAADARPRADAGSR